MEDSRAIDMILKQAAQGLPAANACAYLWQARVQLRCKLSSNEVFSKLFLV